MENRSCRLHLKATTIVHGPDPVMDAGTRLAQAQVDLRIAT